MRKARVATFCTVWAAILGAMAFLLVACGSEDGDTPTEASQPEPTSTIAVLPDNTSTAISEPATATSEPEVAMKEVELPTATSAPEATEVPAPTAVPAPTEVPVAMAPERDLDIVTLLPFDAIRSIDSPTFISDLERADMFYKDHELVLGVEIDGDARAYSVPLLSSHEIVNDVVGGKPIAVTW